MRAENFVKKCNTGRIPPLLTVITVQHKSPEPANGISEVSDGWELEMRPPEL